MEEVIDSLIQLTRGTFQSWDQVDGSPAAQHLFVAIHRLADQWPVDPSGRTIVGLIKLEAERRIKSGPDYKPDLMLVKSQSVAEDETCCICQSSGLCGGRLILRSSGSFDQPVCSNSCRKPLVAVYNVLTFLARIAFKKHRNVASATDDQLRRHLAKHYARYLDDLQPPPPPVDRRASGPPPGHPGDPWTPPDHDYYLNRAGAKHHLAGIACPTYKSLRNRTLHQSGVIPIGVYPVPPDAKSTPCTLCVQIADFRAHRAATNAPAVDKDGAAQSSPPRKRGHKRGLERPVEQGGGGGGGGGGKKHNGGPRVSASLVEKALLESVDAGGTVHIPTLVAFLQGVVTAAAK